MSEKRIFLMLRDDFFLGGGGGGLMDAGRGLVAAYFTVSCTHAAEQR